MENTTGNRMWPI